MKEIMFCVPEHKQTPAIQRLLADARATVDWQATLLAVQSDGSVTVTLWDSEPGSDDPISVVVRSTLSYRERALKFGVEGLECNQIDEQATLQARAERRIGALAAIPNEKYLQAHERVYGLEEQHRRWTVPYDIVQAVRQGRLTPLEGLQKAAEHYLSWLSDGGFQPASRP